MKSNIAEYLPETAAKFAEKDAVKFRNTSVTFAGLEGLSNFYARELRSSGIKKGTKVLMMLRPGIEFIAGVFAVFKTGAVPVLIDPGMGVSNLMNCIRKTAPEAMFGIPRAHWIRLLFQGTFRSVKIFISLGTGAPPFVHSLPLYSPALLKADEENVEIEKTNPDDTAAIVFTTGSTGPPKGVVYTHRIYIAQTEIIRKVYGAGPEHVDMPAFPLFALFSAALGMPSVIPDINPSLPAKADPKVIYDTITENNISFSFASPAIWGRLCAYCRKHNLQVPTLRRVLMAGAPVPPPLHTALKKIINPDGDIYVPYGATEALPIANMTASELTEPIRKRIVSGEGYCVGKPLPGITIKVISPSDAPIDDWNNSLLLPNGETGEIVVEGDVVTPEYHNLPEHTAMAKIRKNDNRIIHRMGDMGYFDKDGYLWFRGRKAHRVFTQNGVLYPVCCEAVFNRHPKVFRSALVGIGEKGNQRPIMIIQPIPGILSLHGEKRKNFIGELKELGRKFEHTAVINNFLFKADFPVDIRHNAKIFREKLAVWAKIFEFSEQS